jgi:hypothetical protein
VDATVLQKKRITKRDYKFKDAKYFSEQEKRTVLRLWKRFLHNLAQNYFDKDEIDFILKMKKRIQNEKE